MSTERSFETYTQLGSDEQLASCVVDTEYGGPDSPVVIEFASGGRVEVRDTAGCVLVTARWGDNGWEALP